MSQIELDHHYFAICFDFIDLKSGQNLFDLT
jgi:hypothetical protein